ncbi:hypothetical protein CF319_g7614 [Tilletia indica]|nr:hypothetical protein CF319_g7614 [Tilletia indica]
MSRSKSSRTPGPLRNIEVPQLSAKSKSSSASAARGRYPKSVAPASSHIFASLFEGTSFQDQASIKKTPLDDSRIVLSKTNPTPSARRRHPKSVAPASSSSFANLFESASSQQQAPINKAPVSYDDSLTDLSVSSSSIDLSATIRVEKPTTEHETAEEKRIADEAAAAEAMRVADEARGG